jgi:hypothetical protein
MRVIYIWILAVAFVFPIEFIAQQNIDYFRVKFETCKEEADFQKLIDTEISDTSAFNINVINAYKSVCRSAMAQYVYNPYTKFKIFLAGKDDLEITIIKEPSVENIFLRLVVQLNVPPFLGYSKDIDHDLLYLQNNLESASIPVRTKKFIVKTIIEIENTNYDLDSLSLLQFKETS